MAGLNDENSGTETAKHLAVELLRQRLKEFESFDWPPGLWDKYDFETALREAELGHYNVACQLLQTHENPLRELIEAGFVALKNWSSTPAHYRRRVDAIDTREDG
jgi:hypothetical protein